MENVLTPAEVAFLAAHGLTVADVYDGRGQSKATREASAKAAGRRIILCSGTCGGGHRLKTRSGHCPVCKPACLAYQIRHFATAYVYIARSPSTDLLKIGVTDDVKQRETTLNYEEAHGGLRDWKVLFSVKVENAGVIERKAIRSLESYKVVRSYVKNVKPQTATELIATDFDRARVAVSNATGDAPCWEAKMGEREAIQ
jgi:hypothetical protein